MKIQTAMLKKKIVNEQDEKPNALIRLLVSIWKGPGLLSTIIGNRQNLKWIILFNCLILYLLKAKSKLVGRWAYSSIIFAIKQSCYAKNYHSILGFPDSNGSISPIQCRHNSHMINISVMIAPEMLTFTTPPSGGRITAWIPLAENQMTTV